MGEKEVKEVREVVVVGKRGGGVSTGSCLSLMEVESHQNEHATDTRRF